MKIQAGYVYPSFIERRRTHLGRSTPVDLAHVTLTGLQREADSALAARKQRGTQEDAFRGKTKWAVARIAKTAVRMTAQIDAFEAEVPAEVRHQAPGRTEALRRELWKACSAVGFDRFARDRLATETAACLRDVSDTFDAELVAMGVTTEPQPDIAPQVL